MADPDNFTNREQRFIKALRQAALSNNPNRDRIGCPDQKTLEAVARRQVPMMDPVIDHVWQCSPCAQEVLRYRKAASRNNRLWIAVGGIAAAQFQTDAQLPWMGSRWVLGVAGCVHAVALSRVTDPKWSKLSLSLYRICPDDEC